MGGAGKATRKIRQCTKEPSVHSSSACRSLVPAQHCPTLHFYWHGQSTWRCEADGHKGTSSPALHHSYREAHILSERQLETFFSPAQNARFKNKKGTREPCSLRRLAGEPASKVGCPSLSLQGPRTALISGWLDGIRKYLKYLDTNYFSHDLRMQIVS